MIKLLKREIIASCDLNQYFFFLVAKQYLKADYNNLKNTCRKMIFNVIYLNILNIIWGEVSENKRTKSLEVFIQKQIEESWFENEALLDIWTCIGNVCLNVFVLSNYKGLNCRRYKQQTVNVVREGEYNFLSIFNQRWV